VVRVVVNHEWVGVPEPAVDESIRWNIPATEAVTGATARVAAAAVLRGASPGAESDSRKGTHRRDDDKSEKPLNSIARPSGRLSALPVAKYGRPSLHARELSENAVGIDNIMLRLR